MEQEKNCLDQKIKMREKYNIYAGAAGLIVFPAIHFYLLEAYTHNGFAEVRQWPQLFNIALFELTAWILAFLLGNIRLALRIEGICAMLAGLVNYYVYTFRSLPLVPWDIFSIRTAVSVTDNYNFMPAFRAAATLAGFAAVLFLEGFCGKRPGKWKWRYGIIPAVLLSFGLFHFAGILQQEEFQNRHLMYNKLFTPVYMWQVNGFALTMVMELPYLSVEKPENYKREEARERLESYENTKETGKAETGKDPEIKPNIIVIMDEAFSDLSVLGDFTVNEEYMPYFRSLFEGAPNTSSGYLQTSVCGGNTANTEFEFLTGNTMAFLPQGSIPYQQYIHNEIPALPSYLNEMGYETHAMHPYLAGGWDRDTVYPLLGFSNMKFLYDYQGRNYIRNYVSDQTCVDAVIQAYEEKEQGKPLFLFQVTMQNHGSYSEPHENFTPDITVDGASSFSLSMYLSLLKKTDEALNRLIAYFSEEEEPVMVVFFGDHQPNDTVAEPVLQLNGKSSRSLSVEDTYLRYQVPYLIWTNYERETKQRLDISVNYLGVHVLEAAGIKLPAYWNFLHDLEKSYPVISASGIKESAERTMNLEEYQKLQYYQLFDIQKEAEDR